MKLALFGFGKMGRLIKELAQARGHSVCAIDPAASGADALQICPAALQDVEVCIDFSHPAAALGNLRAAAELGKSVVMGTTGWYEHLDQARRIVEERGIGFLYAPNFSIGVNAFFKITAEAARIMNRFEGYDVAAVEFHHNKKADSPSGTALTLAEVLKEGMAAKQRPVYDRLNRRIDADELHVASVRCGSIPGTHEVIFDSEADTISLKHTARSRHGFAAGSVTAAEWLCGKSGFFTIEDLLHDLLV
jgi:4-hydroxy-tetrahydrodipicolinate reductase